ncbi:hypothetical protein EDB86DRAFT_3085814 [Lactarius hatsudake]|nr:hypothetical protein EDB86DRAFT_3085814 [Lactarius hatsudake]
MQNGQLYAQYTPMLTLDLHQPQPRCDADQARVAPLVHLDILANNSPTVAFTTITPALVHPRARDSHDGTAWRRRPVYNAYTGPPARVYASSDVPRTFTTAPTTTTSTAARPRLRSTRATCHRTRPNCTCTSSPILSPKNTVLIPAQLQTNPQQTQQQNMTHTPTSASMLIPATVPVHSSSSTEQTLAQIRAQPPAPAPAAGPPFPLTMQMVSTTRMREQVQTQAVPTSVQTHTQQAATVAGASVDATTSANVSASAGAGAGSSAVQSTPGPGPGTQTRGPPRTLQMPPPHALSPQQQHHQRFAVPPALAAFKVLQPAKELLEQTWAAAIAAVQQEFAARLQGERMQALHALHNTQTELKQCMSNFQSERRTRVHLERRLAEMTQLIEKCTCGAASAKISPSTTMTPPPLVVLDHVPPALPSSAPSPVPSSPASVPVLAQAAEARAATHHTNANTRVWSSVRRHEREEDDTETLESESATKRRRIDRTPTPTSSPSAPASEIVAADTREAPAPADKAPTTQAPREQPSPKTAPPQQQQQQQQLETPKCPRRPRAARSGYSTSSWCTRRWGARSNAGCVCSGNARSIPLRTWRRSR